MTSRVMRNPFDHRPVRPNWAAAPFLARKGAGFVSGGHPQTPAKGASPLCTPLFQQPARKGLLLVAVMALLLALPVKAAESGGGAIEGLLVNGTAGGSSVAGREVTLKVFAENVETSSTTTVTDGEGRFVFGDLFIESGRDYVITVVFQGAEYYRRLVFEEGETGRSIDLVVYDSTTSAEAVRIAIAHTVIYLEQDSLLVKEYALVVNESDRTYIGLENSAVLGGREILRFSLPEGAFELRPTLGMMEYCIFATNDGFLHTAPVLPGSTEMAYSYWVGPESDGYTFTRDCYYPTDEYALLVQGDTIQLEADGLTEEEPLEINDIRFAHFAGTELLPGDSVSVRMSDLYPADATLTAVWIAVGSVISVGGLSVAYLVRRRRAAEPGAPREDSDRRRDALLAEIARLDEDFEDGLIAAEDYHTARAAAKAQLLALMRRSGERSDLT